MIDFGVLDRATVETYHEQYVSAVPGKIDWLRREVSRTGGPDGAVDGTPESLDLLWAWLRSRLDEPGGPAIDLPGRPPWYSREKPNPYLSDGALWLVDAVGCYLATVVTAALPDVRWAIHRMPKRYKDVMQNRTVLVGGPKGRPADPASMVYGAVIGTVIHGQPWDPGSLRRLHDWFLTPDAPA